MEMTMQDRQLEILRAIVDEYVATEEPVGSNLLQKNTGLGFHPQQLETIWQFLKMLV